MEKKPTVELKLPVLKDMELVATQTAEVVAKHMQLSDEKSGEISMALIEACINAFEHSETKSEVYIHFIIDDENLIIKVIDKGKGFDASSVAIPKIESKINSEERKRGWGVMLIKELMDSVDFESDHRGTTLTMIKKKNTNE
jgi:serine/threonine-protein kinase RsbW